MLAARGINGGTPVGRTGGARGPRRGGDMTSKKKKKKKKKKKR